MPFAPLSVVWGADLAGSTGLPSAAVTLRARRPDSGWSKACTVTC